MQSTSRNMASSVKPPAQGVKPAAMEYPMMVLRLVDLLQFERIPPHQELLKLGLLHAFDAETGRKALMLSHQWLSSKHPDPDKLQIDCALDFFRDLRDNREPALDDAIRCDWTGQVFGGDDAKLSRKQLRDEFDLLDVWYDWCAIPQTSVNYTEVGKSTTKLDQDFLKAVRSIPAYMEEVHYMFVVAPTLNHVDTRDVVDFLTWSRRGWCRVELMAKLLSANHSRTIILKSRTDAHIMPLHDANMRYAAVGEGTYTVESDKVYVSAVTQSILRHKCKHHEDLGELAQFRFFKAMRATFLSGFPKETIEPDFHPEGTLSQFLSAFHFKAVDDDSVAGGGSGWTPLRYAVIACNLLVVKSILASGKVGLDEALPQPATEFAHLAGATIFMDAAESPEGVEIMRELLEHKANAVATDAGGNNALHQSAKLGRWESVKFLLSLRIFDLECTDMYLNTPLILAAMCCPCPPLIRELIGARAKIQQRNSLGTTALHLAAMHGNHLAVRAILDCCKDGVVDDGVNFRKAATVPFGHYLHLSHEIQRHFITKGKGIAGPEVVDLFGLDRGNTALHDAARYGWLAVVKMLVMAGADTNLTNGLGRTAAQLAAIANHKEIVQHLRPTRASNTNVPSAGLFSRWMTCGGSTACGPTCGERIDIVDNVSGVDSGVKAEFLKSFQELPAELQEKVLTDLKPYTKAAPVASGQSAADRFSLMLHDM